MPDETPHLKEALDMVQELTKALHLATRGTNNFLAKQTLARAQALLDEHSRGYPRD